MATKMVMPLLGQTMEEGTIIKWFKNEGDQVKEGEPLLEVMTDKVNMEVEAPESGVLRKILAQPDDIVAVKDPICIIGTAGESIDALLAEGPATAAQAPEAEAAAPVVQEGPAAQPVAAAPAGDERIYASPAAKRAAKEKGINIAALVGRGTGPNGRIVEKDVLDYAAVMPKATPVAGRMAADMGVAVSAIPGTGIGGKVTSEDVRRGPAAPAPAAAPLSIGQTIRFAGMRKAIAQNVFASYSTAVHVTLVTEVDMTECVKMRGQMLDEVEKLYGVRISYTDIIAKAVARAIIDKPIVNASLEGDQIVIHDRVNIGIATALETGLVVPVVKDVQSKAIPQISKEIKELAAGAKSGQLPAEAYRDGTFTITNLGTYGIDSFDPVITPGQSAILGVCRIAEKPVVKDGQIVARSMMNLCLSFDHRIMDGAPAAEYLARLRAILEAPYLLFL